MNCVEWIEDCPCCGCYWNDNCPAACNNLRLWAIDQEFDYAPGREEVGYQPATDIFNTI